MEVEQVVREKGSVGAHITHAENEVAQLESRKDKMELHLQSLQEGIAQKKEEIETFRAEVTELRTGRAPAAGLPGEEDLQVMDEADGTGPVVEDDHRAGAETAARLRREIWMQTRPEVLSSFTGSLHIP